MIRITLRPSVATLAVTVGLLAAAGPAAITMLDYEGTAVRTITYNGHAGLGSAGPTDPPAASAAGRSPRPDTSSLR
jgi:hypothetical protein